MILLAYVTIIFFIIFVFICTKGSSIQAKAINEHRIRDDMSFPVLSHFSFFDHYVKIIKKCFVSSKFCDFKITLKLCQNLESSPMKLTPDVG